MATNKKEFAVFTKRNILSEINSEKDPTKKAALRKERTAKIKVMKFLGDSRADKFAADKEMIPSMLGRKMPAQAMPKAMPKAPASMPSAMRTVAPTKATPKAPASMPAAMRTVAPAKKAPAKPAPKKTKK